MTSKKAKKIVVLATGGTIAGTLNPPGSPTSYTAAQLGVQDLVAVIPNLSEALQGDELVSEQVAQLDSRNMNHAVWQNLARRCVHWLNQEDVRGLVITHGTDTLEETAWFLQQVLDTSKPVVMTCAMRPANAPDPDGPANLRDALTLVREPDARGVLVVCAGAVHQAHEVQKVHPTRLTAFASPQNGPCATVRWPEVRWAHKPTGAQPHAHASLALNTPTEHWPWVAVLHNHANVDPRQVQALVDAGVKGIALAGTGNGSASDGLIQALLKAQSQGIGVRSCTRCAEGPIVGQPNPLPLAPLGLNVYKARISLMLDQLASA